jgi:phosphoesterase RecJ-like protein
VKASFRSRGDVAVNGWAGRFGGGGHVNAAGAFLDGRSLTRALKEIVDGAPAHLVLDPDVAQAPATGELSPDDRALLEAFQGSLSQRRR